MTAPASSIDLVGMQIAPPVQTVAAEQKGFAFGHIFTWIRDKIIAPVFRVGNEIRNDMNALATLMRGIGYALLGINAAKGTSILSKFNGRITDATNLIDGIQIFGDVDYFVNKCKNDWAEHKFTIFGRVALLVADIGAAMLLVEEMGFVKLAQVAQAIGKIRVFAFVPLMNIGTFINGACGIGFALLGVDAIIRLAKPGNHWQKTKAWLDLAQCVAEVAGKTIMLVGVVNPFAIAGLGVIAAGLGLSSFIYGAFNADKMSAEEAETELRATR